MPYWVYRGVYNGLYQYYILPTRAARQDPKKFQLSKEDIDALILFDDNTRERLNGSIKEVSAY